MSIATQAPATPSSPPPDRQLRLDDRVTRPTFERSVQRLHGQDAAQSTVGLPHTEEHLRRQEQCLQRHEQTLLNLGPPIAEAETDPDIIGVWQDRISSADVD